jgi:hypothetical protein
MSCDTKDPMIGVQPEKECGKKEVTAQYQKAEDWK